MNLAADAARAKAVNAFTTYHSAYHGTTVKSLLGILRTGCLCKPGDTVLGGRTIAISHGPIPGPFQRTNGFTGKKEMFDPNQIFLSPVLEYSLYGAFAVAVPYVVFSRVGSLNLPAHC